MYVYDIYIHRHIIYRQVAKRLAFGFGAKVIYCEAFGRMQYDVSYGAEYVESMDELLKRADIVVPLCPLLPNEDEDDDDDDTFFLFELRLIFDAMSCVNNINLSLFSIVSILCLI